MSRMLRWRAHMPYQVVITDFVIDHTDVEERVFGDLAQVTALAATKEEELWGRIEQADAVMAFHTLAISRRTIERLEQCKLIVRCGVGFDSVDHAFARERGIPVANVPSYGTEEVADSAIGLMLSMTRGISRMNALLRDDPALPWHHEPITPALRLRGRVFATVGVGRIGTAAVLRAKALGMDVAYYDPYAPDGLEKALGIRRVDTLEELLRQAYVVSVHCPLTPETLHLLNAEALRLLPRGSYLVNTARGAVVDTAAIPELIASGQLAGAGIDVLETEPPSADHPLIRAWRDPRHPAHTRVVLNPHSAFYCEEGLLEMRQKGAEECRRALRGERLRNVINGL